MVTRLPPSPYKLPYIDALPRHKIGHLWTVSSAAPDIHPMVGGASLAWLYLEPLLATVEAGRHPYFGKVARVEFVAENQTDHNAQNLCGVVLFDASGSVIVHAVSAPLACDAGRDTHLSQQLLSELGVGREVIEELRFAVADGDSYVIVVSRETPSPLEDPANPMVTHDEPLQEHWRWWLAR